MNLVEKINDYRPVIYSSMYATFLSQYQGMDPELYMPMAATTGFLLSVELIRSFFLIFDKKPIEHPLVSFYKNMKKTNLSNQKE